jgi:serpin B
MKTGNAVVLLAALAAGVTFAGCGGGDETVAERGPRSATLKVEPKLVTAVNDFGIRLYRQLAEKPGNVFFSPTSIELALGMAYNGARGSSKDGMARALGYGSMTLEEVNQANAELLALLANPDPKVDLFIANAVWAKQGVTYNEGFMQRCKDSFLAEPMTVDFRQPEAAQTINGWVKTHTKDKIAEIVSAEAISDAIMVLTNAIYFKAGWTDEFPASATKDGTFKTGDGKEVTVPMMARSARMEYLENEHFQMVRLPYQGQFVGMYVLLPRPGVTLKDCVAKMTAADWKSWTAAMTKRQGEVKMPRFKTDYATSLKSALAALGMADAFDPSKADLNGILPPGATSERVFISDALHKTYLSVDEQGTEAAAATAVIMGITSAPAPAEPFSMVVDRPFLLAIADKPTGVILFLGSISSPK